jgi:hypothetical protein
MLQAESIDFYVMTCWWLIYRSADISLIAALGNP